MRNRSKLERARVSEAKHIDKLCAGAVDTRHEAQMQTKRDRPCVAKKIDRLSDGVDVGTQVEPARASYQVSRLERQIGHLERQVGRLGCQVGCLGRQVGRLGRQVGRLGRQVGCLGHQVGHPERFGFDFGWILKGSDR